MKEFKKLTSFWQEALTKFIGDELEQISEFSQKQEKQGIRIWLSEYPDFNGIKLLM